MQNLTEKGVKKYMNKDKDKKEVKEGEQEDFKKVVEAVTEAVTPKTVDAVLAKLKEDKPLRKGIFSQEDASHAERSELTEKKELAAEFFKALSQKDTVRAK